MKKSIAAVAVSAVALSLALAACGSTTTSTSTSTATSTTTSATSATAAPSSPAEQPGPNPTIADYIKENGIVETPVHRGDQGGPTINLPIPTGWTDAGEQTPDYAYGAIVDSDPEVASDPPTVISLVSKLTGDVDPAKILELAPGEIKNLAGYEAMGDGAAATLSGFNAYQIGGSYQKNGQTRVIAQKTVVIPEPGALYVLQLNAEGSQDQLSALMDATNTIDEQTTITA
jgi:hypothetical protein